MEGLLDGISGLLFGLAIAGSGSFGLGCVLMCMCVIIGVRNVVAFAFALISYGNHLLQCKFGVVWVWGYKRYCCTCRV